MTNEHEDELVAFLRDIREESQELKRRLWDVVCDWVNEVEEKEMTIGAACNAVMNASASLSADMLILAQQITQEEDMDERLCDWHEHVEDLRSKRMAQQRAEEN